MTLALTLFFSLSYSQTRLVGVDSIKLKEFKELVNNIIVNNKIENFEYKGKSVVIRESPKYTRSKAGINYEVLYENMYAFFFSGKDFYTQTAFFNERKSFNLNMKKIGDKAYYNGDVYLEKVTDFKKLFFVEYNILKEVKKYGRKKYEKKKYALNGDKGVKLEVEIEYSINELGYMNNNCEAQYIVTNISNVPYSYNTNKKTYIVFEFTSTDGKIIEERDNFTHNLQPGRTAPVDNISINSGIDRICQSVKVVRLEGDN